MFSWILWLIGLGASLCGFILLYSIFLTKDQNSENDDDNSWSSVTKFEDINNSDIFTGITLVVIGLIIYNDKSLSVSLIFLLLFALLALLIYRLFKQNSVDDIKMFFVDFKKSFDEKDFTSESSTFYKRRFFIGFVMVSLIPFFMIPDTNSSSGKSTKSNNSSSYSSSSTKSNKYTIRGRDGCPLKNGQEYAGSPGYAAGEIYRHSGSLNDSLNNCKRCAIAARNVAISAGKRVDGMGPMYDACFELYNKYRMNPDAWKAIKK